MAIYTKIQASDLKKIVAPYGIEVIEFIPIEGGNANTSYHLKTKKGEYILTIAEESTLNEAKALASLLQWLKKYDFPTSEVQITANGEFVIRFLEKPVILKKWIFGKVYEDLSYEMLEQIGCSLARLHQIPAPEYLPRFQSYGLQSFVNAIGKGIDSKYENWLEKQFIRIKKNLPEKLPKGFIHGDLFFDNVIIQAGELKAIIDFEEACYYFLTFDLGMSIVGLCQTKSKIDLRKAKAFIKGYQRIRPLEFLEKESLQLFIEYAATATSNWRFCKYNILSPNSDSKNKHWEMVQIAQDVKSISKTHFYSNVLH